MSLPDLIFSLGGAILALGLLPSVLGDEKPALATSVITGAVIITFALTFSMMGLWVSGAINGIQSILWATLAVQEFRARGER